MRPRRFVLAVESTVRVDSKRQWISRRRAEPSTSTPQAASLHLQASCRTLGGRREKPWEESSWRCDAKILVSRQAKLSSERTTTICKKNPLSPNGRRVRIGGSSGIGQGRIIRRRLCLGTHCDYLASSRLGLAVVVGLGWRSKKKRLRVAVTIIRSSFGGSSAKNREGTYYFCLGLFFFF